MKFPMRAAARPAWGLTVSARSIFAADEWQRRAVDARVSVEGKEFR